MSKQTFDNFIDGQWCSAESYLDNINPSDTNDLIGAYASASETDCRRAISAAKAAGAGWAKSGLEQRKDILDFIGNELISRKEELGEILSREEGKPIPEGIGEVGRAGQFFQYYAAEVLRQIGETANSVRAGVEIEVHREPVGVVGIITPWNFPTAIAAWKTAPALAFGNSVVLKPSEITPASAWVLTEIISRSGLPNGVFNLVMGTGEQVGNALAKSADVDALSFTGSVATGRTVARNALENMTRIQLEMGSKNALVVLHDADLDLAVDCAVNGAFFGSGQKCTASSRIIVEADVHDEFVQRMKIKTEQLVVGPASQATTQIGPIVDKKQFESVLNYIQLAKDEGARLVCGGLSEEHSTPGYYVQPTLFSETTNDMRVNREEMFGPIACVIKAKDYDHALALSNDSDYGLTAGIMTNSLKHSAHFKKNAQAGCVMVNLPTAGTDYHVPFGGRKASSYGPREQGQYAKEFYTVVKTNYSKPY